ncbi:heavy metal-associated isoprenylated plant protein 47-like isoform X2 [Cicer arietinum]|uniref:Heavy metal-associated isoprenylated plant protein 47-like isoform X2 n=1 Tax=Cicer arietinum TaxID=3827 RepID=A0A1S3EH58_CICAR|nr:heavy metal-associated isoprenylated plant protein 47-like isoform X2 [Cicer arietinum]
MKQKIVIKLHMDCEKCRNKALKTAAEVKGVVSVALEGDDKDRVCVTGDNIDTVCLANMLKKKFNDVTILSVEEVKNKTAEEKKKEEDKKKEEEKKKMMEACHDVLYHSCNTCKSSNCHGYHHK